MEVSFGCCTFSHGIMLGFGGPWGGDCCRPGKTMQRVQLPKPSRCICFALYEYAAVLPRAHAAQFLLCCTSTAKYQTINLLTQSWLTQAAGPQQCSTTSHKLRGFDTELALSSPQLPISAAVPSALTALLVAACM